MINRILGYFGLAVVNNNILLQLKDAQDLKDIYKEIVYDQVDYCKDLESILGLY